jgi:hypothetical protein
MKFRKFPFLFLIGLFSSLLAVNANAQLNFNFLSSTGNANADAGFQMAADYVSSQFDDAVTINIRRGFSGLGGNTLAQAGSEDDTYSFSEFKTAIAGDITSFDDQTFSSNLPTGNFFSVYINETNEATGNSFQNPYVDNDGGANNRTVRLHHANAKALGLRDATDSAQDVGITFNSSFTWDFDPTDGIDNGAIDFVGVTIHEIMHGLGFSSGVDVLDFEDNDDGDFNDNQFIFVNSLDFARFSADALNEGADIDWTADNRAKFYSIDGGLTPGSALGGGIDHFSRGTENGDGNQASHWRDGLGLGIMDPTSAPAGNANVVSELDLQALDIIGWNRVGASVPEPGSAMILALFCGGLGLTRRRRR